MVKFPVQSQVFVHAECVVLDGRPYEEISSISLNVSGNEIFVTKELKKFAQSQFECSQLHICFNPATILTICLLIYA